MNKPHIAMVLPTVEAIGGAERQVLLLARSLAARGWRVTVVSLSGTRPPEEGGFEWRSLGMRKAWIDPRGWLRFLRWYREQAPDLVHAHLPHASWFVRWARLIAPVRVVLDTIHTSAVGAPGRSLSYRLSNFLTDHVTCVSRAVADAHRPSLPAGRTSVLPNGIPLPPVPDHKPESTSFRWVAVGRLAPVKDYPTLLRAFARLPSCAQLEIVGTGPEEARLFSLVGDLDVRDRVRFAGFHAKVQPFLDVADGFVLSSLWEGLPVSILEAAASSLPVVATSGRGTAEAMLPGESGLITPVGDPQALATAMRRIMDLSPEERRQMGAKGRAFVEAEFSLEIVTNRWEALYLHLHSTRRNRSRANH